MKGGRFGICRLARQSTFSWWREISLGCGNGTERKEECVLVNVLVDFQGAGFEHGLDDHLRVATISQYIGFNSHAVKLSIDKFRWKRGP